MSNAANQKAYRDRKRGKPPRTPKPCGTYAAWRRHKRNDEEPCEPCRQAKRDYNRKKPC